MNTYQRQLLDKLITELTDNASPNLHTAQMLAAELKGAMQAQTIEDGQSDPQIDTPTPDADIHPITCDCAKCIPNETTPDADGWVENTGEKPKCVVLEVRMLNRATGEIIERPYHNQFWNIEQTLAITHYKPAWKQPSQSSFPLCQTVNRGRYRH